MISGQRARQRFGAFTVTESAELKEVESEEACAAAAESATLGQKISFYPRFRNDRGKRCKR